MSSATQFKTFAAVILAAGKGMRAGQPSPKQFAKWRGKPVLRHSVEAFHNVGANRLIVVLGDGMENEACEALQGLDNIEIIIGGSTRQESVRNAIEHLSASQTEQPLTDVVMIHDSARPGLGSAVIQRLLGALQVAEGAIPVLPVVDSLSIDDGGSMGKSVDRDRLRRVQTPQAFHFDAIVAAHRAWSGPRDAGDDAQVLKANGGTVIHVDGDEALKKLTFAEDFVMHGQSVRTGLGYDVHRLADGEELWLGGVKLEHPRGLAGHSDADVALHAIVDALLGAVGAGDIGDHFPPSDERWKGAPSSRFIQHAANLVESAGYSVASVDLTIICEAPKIGPHKAAIKAQIADLLKVDKEQVNVKATTTEKLGFTGREEGIAAQAIATVIQRDHAQ